MSPEQARGDAIDQRSDLFSLGSVIYAMATGRPPFRAESSYGILRRVCEADARPLREVSSDVPYWLERFVMRRMRAIARKSFRRRRRLQRRWNNV